MKEYRQHKFSTPPGATEIYLVRHGESRAAVPGKPFPMIDGQGDPELSELGRAQAQRVAQRFQDKEIDAIYATSLQRTVETAQPLCDALGKSAQIEADLREVHLGDWEGGLFRVKVHENDPAYLEMQAKQRWDMIPGAESQEKLQERVSRGLQKIIESHKDQLVLAVLHGGVIGHILASITGSQAFAFNGCDNASFSHIVAVDGKIILRGFNDATHLLGLESDILPT